MQKLSGNRTTDTPRNTPLVPGSVALSLNSSQGVVDSGTSFANPDNNSEEALTPAGEQDSRVPVVYVLNIRGKPLMPTSPRKARFLLKRGKATVVSCSPFTIQILYPTGETTQEIILGVDPGYKYIGLSARTDKKVIYTARVQLRNDIVMLNSQRRNYRRTRRSRKWYRESRFLNRKKINGGLVPSVQHKLDSHIKAVNEVKKILPVVFVRVEVANFDIQKVKNPDIQCEEYQHGNQRGFANVREYVFYRDGHTCQHCKGKSGDKKLQVHHLESRQIGGNRPDNLLTVCKTCHYDFHLGKLEITAKPRKGYKPETSMNAICWKLVEELKENNRVEITYGYITKMKRQRMGLSKSHSIDAFVISGGFGQEATGNEYLVKQVRKNNRKLRRGSRSQILNTAPHKVHGFQKFDRVRYRDQECFVFGRRTSGYFDLKKLDGTRVHGSAKYSDLTLISYEGTWLVESIANQKISGSSFVD